VIVPILPVLKATALQVNAPKPHDPKATAPQVIGPILPVLKATALRVIGLTPPVPLAIAPQAIGLTPPVPLAIAHLVTDLQAARRVVAHQVATVVAVVVVAAVVFHLAPSAVASVVPFPVAVVVYRVADATP